MPRYAYVDGRFSAHQDAAVHIEDRGFQFSDGVYEVVTCVGRAFIDMEAHLDRLERSLSELEMPAPVSRRVLTMLMEELVTRNGVRDGLIYVQITRGTAPRDHAFPSNPKPTLVMTTKRVDYFNQKKIVDGCKVITAPDIRWGRCDIKTVSLLPNCIAKTDARRAGADEAWLFDADGAVTEGTSCNAWIVTHDDKLVTRATTDNILKGVTRQTMLDLAVALSLTFEERPFSVIEAKAAREAFSTSATSFVTPVIQIDDTVLGNGAPGLFTARLQEQYFEYCRQAGRA
jgi:D-alanine transaminase